MSFTYSIRQEIKERAGYKSELSERSDRPLTCCHLFHDRLEPEYNSPDMGVYCTDIEHLAYHLIFKYNPHNLGLIRTHNIWALDKLYEGIYNYNESNDIVMSEAELLLEIQKAKDYWYYYLGIEEPIIEC